MKNCLIIAIPRSGASNLFLSIAKANNKKRIFEPFTRSPNIYSHYYKNAVCKMIVYRLEMDSLLKFTENFDKVVLLSRKDLLAAAESFVSMRFDNDTNSIKVWNEVSKLNLKLVPEHLNHMKHWNELIEKVSNKLNIPIDYYEDVYSNKTLIDTSIKLDESYFDSSRKLRGKLGIYSI